MPPYDEGMRRQSKRTGNERGCWLYVPAEVLANVGRLDPRTPPRYRLWPGRSGSVVVTFYSTKNGGRNGTSER